MRLTEKGRLPAAGQIAAAGDHQWVGLVGGVFGLCSRWQEQCGQPVAGQRWVIAISEMLYEMLPK